MAKTRLFAAALFTVALVVGFASAADTPKIEKIVIDGNDRLTQDAFLALTSLRPGDPYDPQVIEKEYKKIWDSGLFDDLSVEAKDGKTGKILLFHVKERPIIATVEFKGSKTLTSSTVLDKLKDNNAEIKSGTVLDYSKIKHTEAALRFMAAEKGFPDAVVSSKVNPIGRSQVSLVFNITQGPKARISKIKFVGNHAFSNLKLRYTMKKTRQHWMFSWASRHDLYTESRFNEDTKLLRDLYESHGYLDVDIGEPIIDSRVNEKKTKKWLTLTIPITEGLSYKMGTVSFEGNHIFTDAELMKGFKFKKGVTLDKVGLGYVMKAIEGKYGQKGYIYATATPIFDKDPKTKIANVTISINEDQQYYLNRIEFYGNTSTRDYVLRREMGIGEQQIFNYQRYQRGLYKLKQTGLFEVKDDPVINKVPNTRTVNVDIKGTEASKNELLFGGGYGGVNGFFISGAYRTYNFFGRGTTLSLNAELGKIQKLYSINYSDPWFFGKRVGLSATLYNQRLSYVQFDQRAMGGSLAFSFPLGDFAGWQVGYRYERSRVDSVYSIVNPNPLYPNYYTNSTTSAVFGGIFLNTVNSPFRPTRGLSLNLNTTVAGAALGGTNYFIKPGFEGSLYLPTFKKQNAAFRVSSGFVTAYDGHGIPPWERFFLGGENSLRGFTTRSVYPITKDGRYFIDPGTGTIEGGNRYILTNAEYVFHIVEQLDLAFFVDAGNTYHERQRWELSNYRGDAGIELRFFVPMFNVPLRLIYSHNLRPKPGDDFSVFQFTIGLTF